MDDVGGQRHQRRRPDELRGLREPGRGRCHPENRRPGACSWTTARCGGGTTSRPTTARTTPRALPARCAPGCSDESLENTYRAGSRRSTTTRSGNGRLVSAPVRSTKLLIAATVLALSVSACGADNPPGTITEDDLPGSVEVDKVRHDEPGRPGRLPRRQQRRGRPRDVALGELRPGPARRGRLRALRCNNQEVSNSVWRLSHPEGGRRGGRRWASTRASKAQPDDLQAVRRRRATRRAGYTAAKARRPSCTPRRILVPLADRVVIVTSKRQGGRRLHGRARGRAEEGDRGLRRAPQGLTATRDTPPEMTNFGVCNALTCADAAIPGVPGFVSREGCMPRGAGVR